MPTGRVSGVARIALAAIRIVNGSTALVAPGVLTRELGDTASAALAGLTRQIPARSAVIVTAISALNTALALTACAGQRRVRTAA
jgi:hypothetical protein